MKMRVYSIADELGVETAIVMKKCQELGIFVKNPKSVVEEADFAILRSALLKDREEVLADRVRRRRSLKPPAPSSLPVQAVQTLASEPLETKMPASTHEAVPPAALIGEDQVSSTVSSAVAKAAAPGEGSPLEETSRPSISKKEEAQATLGTQAAPTAAVPTEQETSKEFIPRIVGHIQLSHPAGRPGQRIHHEEGRAQEGRGATVQKAQVQAATPAPTTARRFEVVKAESLLWESKLKKPRKKKVAPGTKVRKTEITVPKASKRIIRIEGKIQLQELAKSLSTKATELLMRLLQMGVSGININSSLDSDTAKIIASEYGYEVEDVAMDEEGLLQAAMEGEEEEEDLITRPPIVTVMGHVDHGKTTLLDSIRKTRVAEGEAGGITQRIGASVVETPSGKIVFIDTPGHEAFTAMRARGAQVTDLVILVVAANDGVQEQTIESINHAKAAGVPIIVAINKIDLPNANTERIKKDLSELGVIPEEWGGDTIFTEVSATTGKGIDRLLELVLVQAEVLELKTNPRRGAHGVIIESRLDRTKGPMASVVIKTGVLRVGDYVVAGTTHGRVRAMIDSFGRAVSEADPSVPVEILGLADVPAAGDSIDVITDIKKAQWIAESRAAKAGGGAGAAVTKTDLLTKIGERGAVELAVIVKADVHGVMEAIRSAIQSLTSEKVQVSVIHSSVGAITESDVMLASASKALVVGFNVRPAGKAKQIADEEGVQIRFHTIIYEMLDDLRGVIEGMITPEYVERIVGKAKVLKTFKISKIGIVAGCLVEEGKLVNRSMARLLRDSVVIWTGKLGSLQRFKDAVKEVAAGQECGVALEGYQDIKEGDLIEVFELVEKEVTN